MVRISNFQFEEAGSIPAGSTMVYFCDNQRHLVCLPYSKENLHKMAKDLGIKRCWFHKDHYDIPKRRILEIEERCTKVDWRGVLLIIHGGVILENSVGVV